MIGHLGVMILFLTCFVVLLYFLMMGANPWGGNPTFTRCERVYPDNLLREPYNSFSSLLFIYVGLYFVFAGMSDTYDPWMNHLGNFSFIFKLNGVCLIVGGIGAFLAHACGGQCYFAEFLDHVGIYMIAFALLHTFVLFIYIHQDPLADISHRSIKKSILCSMFFCLLISCMHDLYLLVTSFFVLKGLLLIGITIICICMLYSCRLARRMELISNYDYILISLSFLFLVTGVICWFPEEMLHECVYPQLQLHALWHICIALSVGCSLLWLRLIGRERVRDLLLLKGH